MVTPNSSNSSSGLPNDPFVVDEAQAAFRLAIEENVLRRRSASGSGSSPGRSSPRRRDGPRPRWLPGSALPPISIWPEVGWKHSAQDLQQRRLAGAVLAQERMDFAVSDAEVDVSERLNAAERLGDPGHPDGDRRSAARSSLARPRSRIRVAPPFAVFGSDRHSRDSNPGLRLARLQDGVGDLGDAAAVVEVRRGLLALRDRAHEVVALDDFRLAVADSQAQGSARAPPP